MKTNKAVCRMISLFIREQKRYSLQELCGLLRCSEDQAVPIIRKLKEYGVLKAVRASISQMDMSELINEDIEVADVEVGEPYYLYVFTFVGVITVAGRVLKCYPKYILKNNTPKKELCQILKVLEKYNSKEQIIRMFNESSEESAFNLLAVLLFLLDDYYENGLYSNSMDIIETNGTGEILWDKTINETFSILSNNRPYYIDLQTRRRVNDEFDYIRRLHECILTKASKELQEADLLELFEISDINLSDEVIDDFGEKDYILYRIEKELNTQFNTRKQLVLKTIYAFIAHEGSLHDAVAISMIGTNSFNLVWESVCADILDNQLNETLGSLKLPLPLKTEYNRKEKLIDLIEKPFWTASQKSATDTFIPDLITISNKQFVIFDAKYYNAQLEYGHIPKAQPGIEAITKQYLYQLAYQRFITDHGFTDIKNCFLMPTEEKDIIDKGEVIMKMLSALGLQNIKVRFLPADIAYEFYLFGKKMDIRSLKL